MRNVARLRRWQAAVAAWVAIFAPLSVLAVILGDLTLRVTVAALGLIGAMAVASLRTLDQMAQRRLELERFFTIPVGPLHAADAYKLGVEREADEAITALGGWQYVPRRCDDDLRVALAEALKADRPRMIVLEGSSTVGKSRTLFQVAKEVAAAATVVAPSGRAQLIALLTKEESLPHRCHPPIILWLDDLERFVGREADRSNGVDQDLLLRLRTWPQPTIALATAGGKGVSLVPQGERNDLATPLSSLLSLSEVTKVPLVSGELETDEEMQAATEAFGKDGARRVQGGIGEFMIVAPKLWSKLVTGRHEPGDEVCPEGQAVTWAAIDWRRSGIVAPISRSGLANLFRDYCPAHLVDKFNDGLRWAEKPLHTATALVRRGQDDSFEPLDWIATRAAWTMRPQIPPQVWGHILDLASPEQATNMGFEAYRKGRENDALVALRRADERGSGSGATLLGILLQDAGHIDDALTVYRRADERGSPVGANNLGVLLRKTGDADAALVAYRRADERGSGEGASNLGIMLQEAGDTEAALAAYRRADERGSGEGASNLGILLREAGDADGALGALRRADERGSGNGANTLGVLLLEAGDTVGALAAYRRADERGSGSGAYNHGSMLRKAGDTAGALAAYWRADQRGSGDGANSLGALLRKAGDTAGALAAYRRADERGSRDGACNLGILLREAGDADGALAAFRRADERGSADGASNLGVMLQDAGDIEAALAAYRRADERGSTTGAYNLGVLLRKAGYTEQAIAAYERAAAGTDDEVAGRAQKAIRQLAT